jgi:hypothetical protein
MKTRRAIWLVAALPFLGAVTGGQAQEVIRAGLWQFSSQGDDTPAAPVGFSPPQGGQGQSLGSSFTSCIDPARTIPTDPQVPCQVEGMRRNGSSVSWVSTCSVPQGTFRSQGVAQYRGDTMQGTLTTEVPILGGQVTQRLSGRYLGPCTR